MYKYAIYLATKQMFTQTIQQTQNDNFVCFLQVHISLQPKLFFDKMGREGKEVHIQNGFMKHFGTKLEKGHKKHDSNRMT